MIAVISDLHLQHVAPEAVRHREGDVVWETGVRRNVSAEAVGLLFDEIAEVAVQRASRVVHLVLAGDLFECHRTPLWFAGEDNGLRPTDAPGPDGSPLCDKVHRVLDAVVEENRAFLAALRERAAAGVGAGIPVHVHYLPGNHDRLVDLWPSTRRRVRAVLGMADDDAPFPRVLDWPAEGGGAGVRVRHGHEYDPPNVGHTAGGIDPSAPCVGDFVTVDVAARLSMAFRVLHARALREPGAPGDAVRALYAAITEFDDVRPPSRLAEFLVARAGANREDVVRLLRPALADVYACSTRDAFFTAHARGGQRVVFSEPVATLFRAAISKMPSALLADAMERVARLDARRIGPALAEGAAREEGLGRRFFTVVSGHTHEPAVVSLGCLGGVDAWYLNSGTWRSRLDAGVGESWGLVRACTMVFCYDDAEATASPDRRRVETWTGRFTADRLGAYRERVPTRGGAARRLVLHDVEVLADAKAGTLDVGADGDGHTFPLRDARAGDRIDLGGATLPLDPDLDGEVWALGPRASRRPSPWGTQRLPRADGGYVLGEGRIGLPDFDAEGRRRVVMRVRYEVM